MQQDHGINSNYSRRAFLKTLGITGAGLGLSGISGCVSNNDDMLRFYGTGPLNIEKSWSKLEEDLHIKLKFQDNDNNPGPIVTNMIKGNAAYDFDIGGVQGGIERELALAKKILPWDLSRIPNWKHTWDWVKTIPHCIVDGKHYGLPVVINADSVLYLPDKIGGTVDSYEVIFDPKYKGKTAMEDAWVNSAIFAAIYLKGNNLAKINDPGDLTEDELSIVMEFLIKKKKEGQFKTFWNGWEDGLRLIRSGEVYAMTGWEPIVYAARNVGVNVEYATPREGYEGWSNDLIIHIGAEDRNTLNDIYDFANWELSGYYGCELAKQRGYIVPNDLSIEYARRDPNFNAADQENKINRLKDKFINSKVYWQNTRPRNFRLYEEWWGKLRNA